MFQSIVKGGWGQHVKRVSSFSSQWKQQAVPVILKRLISKVPSAHSAVSSHLLFMSCCSEVSVSKALNPCRCLLHSPYEQMLLVAGLYCRNIPVILFLSWLRCQVLKPKVWFSDMRFTVSHRLQKEVQSSIFLRCSEIHNSPHTSDLLVDIFLFQPLFLFLLDIFLEEMVHVNWNTSAESFCLFTLHVNFLQRAWLQH